MHRILCFCLTLLLVPASLLAAEDEEPAPASDEEPAPTEGEEPAPATDEEAPTTGEEEPAPATDEEALTTGEEEPAPATEEEVPTTDEESAPASGDETVDSEGSATPSTSVELEEPGEAPVESAEDQAPAEAEPGASPSARESRQGTWLGPDEPAWKLRARRALGHHMGGWGVSALAMLGLETGFYIAGAWSPPGWFQGATVNMAFAIPLAVGFLANALVYDSLKIAASPERMVHHLRQATAWAAGLATGLFHTVFLLVQPLDWAGQMPAGFALFALPLSAVTTAMVLGFWTVCMEIEAGRMKKADGNSEAGPAALRRRAPRLVALAPTGLVLRFW